MSTLYFFFFNGAEAVEPEPEFLEITSLFIPTTTPALFTGDKKVLAKNIDTDGRITIQQRLPMPMTILAIFGDLEVGDFG